MSKSHRITWLVLAALCVTVTANASDRSAPAAPPAHAAPQQQLAPAPNAPDAPQGLQPGPGEGDMEDADELAFLGEDDLLAGDAGPGAGGGEKRVIVRGIVRGPGGMGEAAEGGEPGCGPGCAMMHGGGRGGRMSGPGMGMRMGGRGMGMHPGMGGPLGPLGARLQLTGAQREQLADIRDRQQRRGIQAHADLQLAQLDLRKLVRNERPDAGAINAQIDRVAKVRAELAKGRMASLLEARAVLTPEQQKQLRELHEGGMGGPGGAWGGMAPGAGGDGSGMAPGAGKGHERMMHMRMHGQRDTTGTDSQ